MSKSIAAPQVGRFALITGGSQGIGKAIALELARKGASGIAFTYASNKAAADEVTRELQRLGCERVAAIQANLFSANFGDEIVRAALDKLQTKELHVVVNNAGYAVFDMSTSLDTETRENFDKNMHGNVWGPLLLIKAALPHVAPTGRIINISSAASRQGVPDPLMFYAAAKAALDSVTRSLATTYAPLKKITINSVLVGPTKTETAAAAFRQNPGMEAMFSEKATAEKRVADPKDVADIVGFLASEESRWINGCSMPADGGSQLERQG